jgi:hypothetical protein
MIASSCRCLNPPTSAAARFQYLVSTLTWLQALVMDQISNRKKEHEQWIKTIPLLESQQTSVQDAMPL